MKFLHSWSYWIIRNFGILIRNENLWKDQRLQLFVVPTSGQHFIIIYYFNDFLSTISEIKFDYKNR